MQYSEMKNKRKSTYRNHRGRGRGQIDTYIGYYVILYFVVSALKTIKYIIYNYLETYLLVRSYHRFGISGV